MSEDTQWNREPKRLVVELNEKDTYFFYDRGGWQNHWTEERDGLAAAGKGILCCAWDSKTSFLSIFAPSPAQWSCRLAMVYLLKKGMTLLSDQPRCGDLHLASKSAPLERGSLGTYGHVSAFMPRLSITSKQAGGRMGLLHDMHTALFWKQALTLLFLYCLERHSVREARSPGSKAASLILPSWFAHSIVKRERPSLPATHLGAFAAHSIVKSVTSGVLPTWRHRTHQCKPSPQG